jgi:hypothetical protein
VSGSSWLFWDETLRPPSILYHISEENCSHTSIIFNLCSSLTPTHFIEVLIPRQEMERCICVLGVFILHFLLRFFNWILELFRRLFLVYELLLFCLIVWLYCMFWTNDYYFRTCSVNNTFMKCYGRTNTELDISLCSRSRLDIKQGIKKCIQVRINEKQTV